MDKFDLLSDLADGVLDNEQETLLFSELAINEELRSEFKQLLSFNSAIKNNRSLFAVNESSTNAIFSAIGLPLAGANVATATSGKLIAGIGLTVSKYSQSIIGASVATLTTAALFLLFFNPFNFFSNKENLNQNQKFNSQVLIENDSTIQNSSIPTVNSNELVDNKSNSTNPNIKYIYIDRPIYIEKTEQDKNSQINNSEIVINSIKNEPIILSVNSNEFKKLSNQELPSFEYSPFDNIFIQSDDNLKIEFEIRSSQHWNTQVETITPSKIAEFNNTAISGLYNFNQNFAVGFDLRQETFFQKFQGSDKMGQLNVYEQQPNFTSYSFLLRYGYDVFENFKPIAQVTVGGTNVGFIGRFMTGFQYKFNQELKFILGMEYSNLFYNFQSTNFNSSKIGINYGISYSF